MTKEELILQVQRNTPGTSIAETRRRVNDILDTIRDAVLKGNTVQLAGFGAFSPRTSRTTGTRGDGSKWVREARTTLAFKPYAAAGGREGGPKAKTVAPATKSEGELKNPIGVPGRYSPAATVSTIAPNA